jgi:hypothetical protein
MLKQGCLDAEDLSGASQVAAKEEKTYKKLR